MNIIVDFTFFFKQICSNLLEAHLMHLSSPTCFSSQDMYIQMEHSTNHVCYYEASGKLKALLCMEN